MSGARHCRGCGAVIVRKPGQKGRARRWCTVCRPAGAPPPSRNSTAFRAATERARVQRIRTAARAAVYRRVALAHRDEFDQVYAEELAARLAQHSDMVRSPGLAAGACPAEALARGTDL